MLCYNCQLLEWFCGELPKEVDETSTLIDAPVTEENHPLARYAELFTHNFNLIAERLSVIFNLREFTKAQIVARCSDATSP
eukprot:4326127-Amphidinium_carterae.1